jgi:hypothetical protein
MLIVLKTILELKIMFVAEDAAKGESIKMRDYFTESGWFNAKVQAS